MNRPSTIDAARGKWRGILLHFGLTERHLNGKHGPCPMCEGTDRFRWDNKEGSGSYLCSGCGSGTGMQLVMRFKGWDFPQAAGEIDKVLGRVKAEPIKPPPDRKKQEGDSARLWDSASQITSADPAGLYLASRSLPLPKGRAVLRFATLCPVPGEAGFRPALLALIRGHDGKPVNVHRTFLTPQGRKADMVDPRATMPGELPDGCAIRLGPVAERMGIAEGIETALAASVRFGLPVWAAINTTMLSKWRAPEGCNEVVVFADHDLKFGGQAAAYTVAHRLTCRDKARVRVELPPIPGTDWADPQNREAA
jgi:putative DNA primase/helicase